MRRRQRALVCKTCDSCLHRRGVLHDNFNFEGLTEEESFAKHIKDVVAYEDQLNIGVPPKKVFLLGQPQAGPGHGRDRPQRVQ